MSVAPLLVAPFFVALSSLAAASPAAPPAGAGPGETLLQDDFDRTERNDEKEQVGGGWTTNSWSAFGGNKQADLKDGALCMTMYKAPGEEPKRFAHVSVRHEVRPAWADGTLTLRFKLPPDGDLTVSLADSANTKAVHSGHVTFVKVRRDLVLIQDYKSGMMEAARWERMKAGTLTPEDRRAMKDATRRVRTETAPDQWHDLSVSTVGDVLSVRIDGEPVGELTSPGVAHPTKRTLRLGTSDVAWVDDLKLVAGPAAPAGRDGRRR